MTLYYVSSEGTKINLMGDGIYAQEPETLSPGTWDYNTITRNNNFAKVKNFYRSLQELKLKLSIMFDSREEFNRRMDELYRVMERDVYLLKPGRLYWNDWYKEVYAVDLAFGDFDEGYEAIEKDITFLTVNPSWVKEQTKMIIYGTSDSNDTDYPLDHPYDLGYPVKAITFNNESAMACDFRLTLFGAAESPAIMIGGHRYEVFCDLAHNEKVVIDSRNKTITLYDGYGHETNVFSKRNRESYIFEKIPEGRCAVIPLSESDAQLTIYIERSEPIWI